MVDPPVTPRAAVFRLARWAVVSLAALGMGWYVLVAGFGAGPQWGRSFAVDWLPTVHSATALALVAVRVLGTRRDRGPWLALGAGIILWIAGDITWSLMGFPSSSVADIFYLSFFVFAYVSIALMVRSAAGRGGVSAWLDGLIAALCVASAAAIFVFPRVVASAEGQPVIALVVNVAYPVADVLLLAAALVATSLSGWRPNGALAVLIPALLLEGLADLAYLVGLTLPTPPLPDWVMQVMWSTAVLGMAAASQFSGQVRALERAPGLHALVGPGLFAASALALLTGLAIGGGSTAGALLAAAALVLLLARMGLYFREVARLSTGLATAEHAAKRDSLTGLLNHGAFHALAETRINAAQHDGTHLGLILIDLDHFKAVNDTFGHAAGDRVLREVARVLAAAGRTEDAVGRVGGEELAWLLPHAGFDQAAGAGERLRASIANTPVDGVGFVTASIGVVSLAPGESAVSLFNRADAALYAAKHGGRNLVLAQAEPSAELITVAA